MTASNDNAELDRLIRRFQVSDLDPRSLDNTRSRVDRLCSEYSTENPEVVSARAMAALAEVDDLLSRRLRLPDRRVLLEQAGWLALLLAALAYDLGRPQPAERTRQLALTIGSDLDSYSILGWAHETAVWAELAKANWREARHKASAGLDVVGRGESTGVAIQLALQHAEASARIGDLDAMHNALERGRHLLSEHEQPTNPMHHFRFDHAKLDLREMRIFLIVGRDDEAEQIAVRLLDELRTSDGSSTHPMRTSELLASRGLIEARRGDIDRAVEYADQAIAIGRRSRLSFHQITSAVSDELAKHGDHPGVQRFLDHRHHLLQVDADAKR